MAEATHKIKTINGSRRHVIYYDPDVFNDKILLSAHLLVENNNEEEFHYNTIFNEDLGVSGEEWKPMEDITIPIYPKPKSTTIFGPRNVKLNDVQEFTIDPLYDQENLFTYEWDLLEGNAEFDGTSGGTNLITGKLVKIHFTNNGKTTIRCKVSNPSGCFRYMIKNVYTGLVSKQMLIVKNPYF